MNKLSALLKNKKKDILNIYFSAGFPRLDDTNKILRSLEKYGADIVEIGMPYSDPLADGPVIQQSNMIALQNGITIQKLFSQLKENKTVSLPVILMGYLNPVLQFGFEQFCQQASDVGIDGLILPDLPMYEYENEYRSIIKKYGLDFIFLITPETSEERIRKIDELSTGFIYAVSSSSTTGKDTQIQEQENYFKKLQKMNLKNPVLVGFGIKNKVTFQAACKYTNGAIIGSAYIKALQSADDVEAATQQFLQKILD